jgi:hypothetical protein
VAAAARREGQAGGGILGEEDDAVGGEQVHEILAGGDRVGLRAAGHPAGSHDVAQVGQPACELEHLRPALEARRQVELHRAALPRQGAAPAARAGRPHARVRILDVRGPGFD